MLHFLYERADNLAFRNAVRNADTLVYRAMFEQLGAEMDAISPSQRNAREAVAEIWIRPHNERVG